MNKKWFQIGLFSIFLLSLILRFWGLERFNTFVFDEFHYAKFGNDYLTHVPFFDAHPPLGKLIIAAGIWLGSHVPWWQDTVNGLTGSMRSPVSYRWLNALFGSFIPMILAGIAYQISQRRSYALIAALLSACDGIFLVESRYALINQYIVIFGLLGQYFLLLALNYQKRYTPRRYFLWLTLAGVAFGGSVGTKWNGVFYLGGVYLLWAIAWIMRLLQSPRSLALISKFADRNVNQNSLFNSEHRQKHPSFTPLQNLAKLHIAHLGFFLAIVPAAIYSLIWIPHLRLDTRYNFVEVHKQILSFHNHLGGNDAAIHPYCAAWYKWPLLTRPIAYFYETAHSLTDPLPVMGPPLPADASHVVYDVHALGNPFLWWFGLGSIILLFVILVWGVFQPLMQQKRLVLPTSLSVEIWISLYLVVNYLVNLLPWVRVSRCTYIYHYMTGVVFTFLAIALIVEHCLRSYLPPLRFAGVSIIFLILIAFVFWMPIYLGLPLNSSGHHLRILGVPLHLSDYHIRMWFPSWI
jgi:dolichyl-phosphate-mannose-protein mannosyltransferase